MYRWMSVVVCLLAGLWGSYGVAADTPSCAACYRVPVQNEVLYTVAVKTNVLTQTAQVMLAIHVTARAAEIAKLEADVRQKLTQIAPKEAWLIQPEARTIDPSGLQTVDWRVLARLPQAIVSQLPHKAQALSTASEQISIAATDFSPTQAELAAAEALLRLHVYQQVKAEIAELARVYPEAHYVLHRIQFSDGGANMSMPLAANTMMLTKTASAPSLGVGQELRLSASVTLIEKMS